MYICTSVPKSFWICFLQYDPQASGVIDYQALMKELLHSDYYALYLGSVDNTQNTLDATSTFNMITNLKTQFAAQGHKLQQVSVQFHFLIDEHSPCAYYVGAMCLCVVRKRCRNVNGSRCPVALMQPDVVRKHCGRRRIRTAVC